MKMILDLLLYLYNEIYVQYLEMLLKLLHNLKTYLRKHFRIPIIKQNEGKYFTIFILYYRYINL